MEYHIFWILYAVIFLGASVGTADYVLDKDCAKYGEITKQETKLVGLTCYVKHGEEWMVKP